MCDGIGVAALLVGKVRGHPHPLPGQRRSNASLPVRVDAAEVEQILHIDAGQQRNAVLGIDQYLPGAIHLIAVGIHVPGSLRGSLVALSVDAAELGSWIGIDVHAAAHGIGIQLHHLDAVGQFNQFVAVQAPVEVDAPLEILFPDGAHRQGQLYALVGDVTGIQEL